MCHFSALPKLDTGFTPGSRACDLMIEATLRLIAFSFVLAEACLREEENHRKGDFQLLELTYLFEF